MKEIISKVREETNQYGKNQNGKEEAKENLLQRIIFNNVTC